MLWLRREARLARRPKISQRQTRRICWPVPPSLAEYGFLRPADAEDLWDPRRACSRWRLACSRLGASRFASMLGASRSTSRSASSPAAGLPARPAVRPISRSTIRGPRRGNICASSSTRLSSTPPCPAFVVAHAARPGRSRFPGPAVAAGSASCSTPS